MKLKKWLYLFLTVMLILNIPGALCDASEKVSSDLIKFQGTAWESDAKGANVFIGTLQNLAGKNIEFIGLRCAFYDVNRVELDHGVVIIRDVAKDGVTTFKFYPSAPVGTVTATITEVDVYAK